MTKYLLCLLLLFLTGCQTALAPALTPTPAWTPVPIPATATAEAAPIAAPLPGATVAASVPQDAVLLNGAEDAARAYFAALEAGDFTAAAGVYSDFSLMMAGITREQAALALQAQMAAGTQWSALDVRDITWFHETGLVRVAYQKETKDAKTGEVTQAAVNELWPLRLETGQWRYNLDNVIDYRVLDTPEQTTAGLTLKPRRLTRYTDRLLLTLLAQNRTNEPIVLGQANEIMAAFTFNGQQVEAVKHQFIFDRLRSYPEVTMEIKGLYQDFPDGVIIRQWKGLKVAPWFTFTFTD